MSVETLPDRIARLSPWQRRGLAFGLGAATVLGLPPVDFWPIAFITLPVLLWLLDAAPTRRAAFGTGWWFGFGYLGVGWYWISNAILVFSDSMWWAVPFALIGLPGAMAAYHGLALMAVRLAFGRDPGGRPARVLAAAGALSAADMLRGVAFTGFPWNTFGYLWSGTEPLSQGAAWIGVYGLGVLVLLSGFLPALATDRRYRIAVLGAAAAIPGIVFGLGVVRLADAPDLTAQQADPSRPGLRMVQANIPQREKWGRDYLVRNFDRHLTASEARRPDWVHTVLWPETAAAFLIADPAFLDYRTVAGQRAVPDGGLLITGAPRRERTPPAVYNSVVAIDGLGAVTASYDKAHLVPFGEYVPLAGLLSAFDMTAGAGAFSPGPGPRTLTLDGLPPVSALICYEAIFPGVVTDSAHRPDWLLNVTNDAWYGNTAGPYQHLQHARMRAVEEGLPLVRPANTGISIAFDAYGREIGRIPLSEEGVVDFRLPGPISETYFARYGNLPALGLTVLVALSGFLLWYRRGKRAHT